MADSTRKGAGDHPREAGVLLHPTSLWGEWGIGTLGGELRAFVNWAAEAGFKWWQVLPLSPTGVGNSPYQPISSFAGNPLLLSPELLHADGLLTREELATASLPPEARVDWGNLLPHRFRLNGIAAARALRLNPRGFSEFCSAHAGWLNPWAAYAALKEAGDQAPWWQWKAQAPNPELEEVHRMVQFLFHEQWSRALALCESAGIRVLGDLPIYSSLDSADVWSRRDLFMLDEHGAPTVVAGVPPDYFSSTGQLWGNPLYDWKAHAEEGYQWWAHRLSRTLELCHTVRIDHFRGFCDYWEIPADADTAVNGTWKTGPGIRFFRKVSRHLGGMPPIVAEDLGIITPEVRRLRDELGFPGMVVLQFALDDPDFIPSRVSRNTVIYTGTHDNDTTRGWLESTGRHQSLEDVVSTALDSPSKLCVLPVQDILGLGAEARMNTPGTAWGNWSFRLRPGSLETRNARKCRALLSSGGRA